MNSIKTKVAVGAAVMTTLLAGSSSAFAGVMEGQFSLLNSAYSSAYAKTTNTKSSTVLYKTDNSGIDYVLTKTQADAQFAYVDTSALKSIKKGTQVTITASSLFELEAGTKVRLYMETPSSDGADYVYCYWNYK